MGYYNDQIAALIEAFRSLPGIGEKSAQRLAYHVLKMPEDQVQNLSDTIINAKKKIRYCSCCCTLTDDELCPICKSDKRNHKLIMVVESPRDLAAYERTQKFNGVYHVLHGVMSPALGMSPADLRIEELKKRLEGDVEEVIVATNSTTEGEATAAYISMIVKRMNVKVSRIASGIPVGGDLECVDEVTLMRALEGRKEM